MAREPRYYRKLAAIVRRVEVWLVCVAMVVIFGVSNKARVSENTSYPSWRPSPRSSVVKVTYSGKAIRNYNSGARYYMRRVDSKMTLQTFGYSFYQVDSYYQSGYGYSVYYPAYLYWPCYVDATYVYYPPMFQYFYKWNGRYWNGEEARYVCRNDNAFWPVENQTSEFVQGRLPALDMTQFDTELSDVWDSVSVGVREQNMTVLNSLEMPRPAWAHSNNLNRSNSLKEMRVEQMGGLSALDGGSSKAVRKILTYRYFACPDGKDPNEIYCCGPSTAEFCCTLDTYLSTRTEEPSDWTCVAVVPSLVIATLSVAAIILTLYYRGVLCRKRGAPNSLTRVTNVSDTIVNRAAFASHGNHVTIGYEPVPDEPPSYASCQDAPPTYTGSVAYSACARASVSNQCDDRHFASQTILNPAACAELELCKEDVAEIVDGLLMSPPPYEAVSGASAPQSHQLPQDDAAKRAESAV